MRELVGKARCARRGAARGSRWLLIDVAMTMIMLVMTSVFVGTLALSMS